MVELLNPWPLFFLYWNLYNFKNSADPICGIDRVGPSEPRSGQTKAGNKIGICCFFHYARSIKEYE